MSDATSASVSLSLSTTTARLGDLIGFRVQIGHPGALVVQTPTWPAAVGSFEVHTSTPQPSMPAGEGNVTIIEGVLQNFSTGPQLLSPLPLVLSDGRGKTFHVQTASATVTIQEVPPGPRDKGDIRGIKGAIGPIAISPWWWVVLLLVAAAAGIYFWQRRQQKIQGPPPPPPVPADEEALEALNALLAKGLIESGQIKEFYIAVSDIVRSYLERGFSIPALERTTSELMRDVRRSAKIPSDIQLLLKTLFEECDLVKFAKYIPDNNEALQAHALAVQIVEKTRVDEIR